MVRYLCACGSSNQEVSWRYLQAEIYKEDFLKEQQEKERLWTKNLMLKDFINKMSNVPEVNVKLSF